MYKYIFFDLDGTLTDSGPGITNAVMYALGKFNIEVRERSEVFGFIGPPLLNSFMKFYDFSKEQAEEAITYYREYYSSGGLFENEVYENIPKVLAELRSRGYIPVVATSKPDGFTVKILEHFDLLKYFDFVAAATMDEKRTHKEEVIAYGIKELEISDLKSVLMIGDRDQDINGAQKNGIDSLGVTYGYGSREELEGAGATMIVDSPMEILDVLK